MYLKFVFYSVHPGRLACQVPLGAAIQADPAAQPAGGRGKARCQVRGRVLQVREEVNGSFASLQCNESVSSVKFNHF